MKNNKSSYQEQCELENYKKDKVWNYIISQRIFSNEVIDKGRPDLHSFGTEEFIAARKMFFDKFSESYADNTVINYGKAINPEEVIQNINMRLNKLEWKNKPNKWNNIYDLIVLNEDIQDYRYVKEFAYINIVTAILYKKIVNCDWCWIPQSLTSYKIVESIYNKWIEDGLLDQIMNVYESD